MKSLRKIVAIAENTSLEIIYDKVFVVMIIFSILIILFSRILGLLTPGQEFKLVVDIGLSCIYFFTFLIAVFSGVFLLNRELEKSTILFILSKPVRQHEFILGKYLGLILTILLMIILMLIVYIPVLWGFEQIHFDYILTAVLHKYIEVSLIAAFAVLFSSFCKPVMGIILTFFVHISGILISDLDFIASQSDNIFIRLLLHSVYYVFPNFNNFNVIGIEFNQKITITFSLFYPIIYGILYIILLLTLTLMIFRKRIL
jgi:ABC-type transport system involved in multi-copper enzyme maturation permease subunit